MSSQELKSLIKNRGSLKGQVTRLLNYLCTPQERDVDALEIRKTRLDEINKAFHEVQLQIEVIDDNTDHSGEREDFECQYYQCAELIHKQLRVFNSPVSVSERSASVAPSESNFRKTANTLLPKIEIRPFDGNPIEWHSFKDTFKSLVHENEDIPTVHKFHFLKNALRGNVLSVIESLTATEENYHVAWNLLQKRCNRPRQIIQAHLRSLLELQEIVKEAPSNIRSLAESAEMHVNALAALQQPTQHWDAFLIYIVTRRLDKSTRRAWERSLENDDMPGFKQLLEFLNKYSRGDDVDNTHSMSNKSHARIQTQDTRNINKGNQKVHSYVGTQSNSNCIICRQNHFIHACPVFLKASPSERFELVKNSKLCINCLRSNHSTNKCMAGGCKKCNRRHNTLLHFNENSVSTQAATNVSVDTSREASTSQQSSTTLTAFFNSEVLLGTARIKILDKYNNEHECRVILDGCSQSHFITERLAERLNLKKHAIDWPCSGLGQISTRAKYTVETTIKSRTSSFISNVKFIVLPIITGLLPSQQVNRKALVLPANIKLADPEFHKPSEIDALLGTTLFYKMLRVGQIKLVNDSVILQKTQLGWIVTGNSPVNNYQTAPSTMCYLSANALDAQLNKFWEIEEFPNKGLYSDEENACLKHFKETTMRDANGQYMVRLPFNTERENLGEFYKIALKRFYALERKLAHDTTLHEQYTAFLREYKNLNHMVDVTDSHDITKGFYLPHHAVIKDSSLTTKIRVVFDGSATTSTGISLNTTLMVGPTIQQDLFSLVTRFRSYMYVLTADIEKMYRQIKVHPEDSIYQKIIWRENRDEGLKVFQLNTVTYGTSCAPFLAVKCLQQLADDEQDVFPLAAIAFKHDFYIDDLLTGAHTKEEALQLKSQLIQLANRGNFNLRQWSSNDVSLINDLKNRRDQELLYLDSKEARKTLGIQWNPRTDSFSYSIRDQTEQKYITKRYILSKIAQLFDPLGLLGPVIVRAKILMQHLWKAQISWDETVPQHIYTAWMQLSTNLPLLNNFRVPRKISCNNATDIQLHGFCDASEAAYGACIYIRSINKQEKLVRLVCAKSRVAPTKSISLPRLELCAALLLSKLYKVVVKALNINFHKVRFWSDSTITLCWIKTAPHTLKTFVSNRVSMIQSNTDASDWFHIVSKDNPADYISRGQNPEEFLANTHWLQGPVWLSDDERVWPVAPLETIIIPEQRTNISLLTTNYDASIFERFSSITSLNRFVAYCLRFLNSFRHKITPFQELSVQEVEAAHIRIITIIQSIAFAREIHDLKHNNPVHRKSKLLTLNPFLDSQGILRVGGRLTHADTTYSHKHPIVLPKAHHITELIIRHEHNRHWHAGLQATLNAVRLRYWPIDGKNATRHIIHKCVRCFKNKPSNTEYLMADLPKNRLLEARPFSNVGIDFCGPFFIKERKFRNRNKLKVYVSIFVCMVTRAIHLELVSDLTTEACIAAIKRFVARRGKPKNIYSDNATNFTGSKNELIQIQALLSSAEHTNKIIHVLVNEGISWHFSPPRAPHFGGIWEAGVKSFKQHMHRTVGDSLFTFEQFNTFIIEVESILNSRPLTPLSSDPNDLNALTPSHFLIGDSLMSIPEHDFENIPINCLSAWQHIQQVKQHFWRRWHKDYLHELQTRNKWHINNPNRINIGTLVTIKEDNLPPRQWCLGRIVAVHSGKDGIIRVASVKTSTGTYTRAINRLYPLPIAQENEK